MSKSDIFEWLSVEFASVISPLANTLESKEDLQEFINEIGWQLPDSTSSLGIDSTVISDMVSALESVYDTKSQTSEDDVASHVLGPCAVTQLGLIAHINSIHDRIGAHLDAAFITASNIADELPKRIIDYLVIEHVRRSHEWLFQVLVTVGIFESGSFTTDSATFRSEHTRRVIHYD